MDEPSKEEQQRSKKLQLFMFAIGLLIAAVWSTTALRADHGAFLKKPSPDREPPLTPPVGGTPALDIEYVSLSPALRSLVPQLIPALSEAFGHGVVNHMAEGMKCDVCHEATSTRSVPSVVEQLEAFRPPVFEPSIATIMGRQFNWAGSDTWLAGTSCERRHQHYPKNQTVLNRWIEEEITLQRVLVERWRYAASVKLFPKTSSNNDSCSMAVDDQVVGPPPCRMAKERASRLIKASAHWVDGSGAEDAMDIDATVIRENIPRSNVVPRPTLLKRAAAVGLEQIPKVCCLQDAYGVLLDWDGSVLEDTESKGCRLRPMRKETAQALGCNVTDVFSHDGSRAALEVEQVLNMLAASTSTNSNTKSEKKQRTIFRVATAAAVSEERDAFDFLSLSSSMFVNQATMAKNPQQKHDPILLWDYDMWRNSEPHCATLDDEGCAAKFWSSWLTRTWNSTFTDLIMAKLPARSIFSQRNVAGKATTSSNTSSSKRLMQPEWLSTRQIGYDTIARLGHLGGAVMSPRFFSTPVFAPKTWHPDDFRRAFVDVVTSFMMEVNAAKTDFAHSPFIRAPPLPAPSPSVLSTLNVNRTSSNRTKEEEIVEEATTTLKTSLELYLEEVHFSPSRWIGMLKLLGVLGSEFCYLDVNQETCIQPDASGSQPESNIKVFGARMCRAIWGSSIAWQLAAPSYTQGAVSQAVNTIYKGQEPHKILYVDADLFAAAAKHSDNRSSSPVRGFHMNVSSNMVLGGARVAYFDNGHTVRFAIALASLAGGEAIPVKMHLVAPQLRCDMKTAHGKKCTFNTTPSNNNNDVELSVDLVARPQGSVFIVEQPASNAKTPPSVTQVDDWHKDGHPWYW